MKNQKYLALTLGFVIALTLYVSWVILVLNGVTQKMDDAVVDFMISNRGEKGGFIYWFNLIITQFGYTYAIVAFIILVLILTRINLRSICFTGGIGLAALFNESIKNAYGRPRPDESLRWTTETSCSFPSGHSNCSTFIYGMLIYMVWKSGMKKWEKITLTVLFGLIPVLVYISRMILSVHYFSDIIGGILNGSMFLLVAIFVSEIVSDKTKFDGLRPLIDKKLLKKAED